MSKTNDTSRDELTINDLNRELRDDELAGVSGGLVVLAIIQPLIALDIGPQPANAAAMAAWNTLLGQNGF
jgi:hypothetical protein